MRAVHPIEARSYDILRARADTSGLPPLSRAVVERVIHASADPAYLSDVVVSAEEHLHAAALALRAGAAIVTDSQMAAAGITSALARCWVRDAAADPAAGLTRSAAAIRLAHAEVGSGAVWVLGNAPTALVELIRLGAEPVLVVGLPVGFVGAVEAKQALRASGLPAVTNRSEKGGSAVAAAALNALLYSEVT